MSDAIKIPLDHLHRELGARMVPFAGFEMPVSYKGIIEEHKCVRERVGLFDISHMGILKISGADTLEFLARTLTRSPKQEIGRGAYALLCDEKGGTIDDLIFYRVAEDVVYLALNASNKNEDLAWLKSRASGLKIQWESLFETHSLFALQGPRALALLKECGIELDGRPLYATVEGKIADVACRFFVSGYTGEKGCEISCLASGAEKVFRALLKVGESFGIQPIGLGARDTLRTEMGYSLYGHELSRSINPLEAGLGWAVDLTQNFVGAEVLREYKKNPQRKLIALRNTSLRQAPRSEMKVFDSTGTEVGFITSGTFSPSLGYAIGLAIVSTTSQAPFSVDLRGQKTPFEQTKRPFLQKGA